jgi:hypothetical protein
MCTPYKKDGLLLKRRKPSFFVQRVIDLIKDKKVVTFVVYVWSYSHPTKE